MVGVVCPVLVGRAGELERLCRSAADAAAGHGGLVLVSGEPGVGKSRLVRELIGHAEQAGMVIAAGRAVAGGGSTPFRPLTEALLRALRARPVLDEPTPGLAPWLPALAAVLPAAALPDHHSVAGDASAASRGEAVLRLLAEIGAAEGVVVVLEDLHWADPDTLAVVEYLADSLRRERILVVATLRDEPRTPALEMHDRVARASGALTVGLERLARADVLTMVDACAPDASAAVIERAVAVADGVPLLVEEVLAAPGVPASFAATVRARLDELDAVGVGVLQTAAVLGRLFDWRLLGPAADASPEVVDRALADGVRCLLLAVDGDQFRFRHALSREAVLAEVPPSRRGALAVRLLAALEAVDPGVGSETIDLAADLALTADLPERAGQLLARSGRSSFDRGALATAVDTLQRAVALLPRADDARLSAQRTLVEALALAGRVEEAEAAGASLLSALGDDASARAEVEVTLAHASVAAARWTEAAAHLDAADADRAAPDPRAEVLRAEVAVSTGDLAGARQRAERVLASADVLPDVRCYAWELVGRAHRVHDLGAARVAFEHALDTANSARLPVWRLRALHELGTVEMFDHAGSARLVEAHRAAQDLGALSTVAVLEVHLAAAYLSRWDTDDALRHATAGLELSERLALGRLRTLSYMFICQSNAFAGNIAAAEVALGLGAASAPGDPDIEGSNWCGGRGVPALIAGHVDAAVAHLGRGVALLRQVPASGPACYRGLYPLLLALTADPGAPEAIADARRLGMDVSRGNRGLLAAADAVLAGRAGDAEEAVRLAAAARADIAEFHGWAGMGWWCVAEAAATDGWGEPVAWLAEAAGMLRARNMPALAERCEALLGAPADHLARYRLTERERDVLDLVIEGLANKEIATRLTVSPRTVEKHVESLLRKTGARTRTQLVGIAAGR